MGLSRLGIPRGSSCLRTTRVLPSPPDRPRRLALPHIRVHMYAHAHSCALPGTCVHSQPCTHTDVATHTRMCIHAHPHATPTRAHSRAQVTHLPTYHSVCPGAGDAGRSRGPNTPWGPWPCPPSWPEGGWPSPVGGGGRPGEIVGVQGGGPGSHGLLDGGLLAVGLEQRGGAVGQHSPLIPAELGPAVLKPHLG